MKKNIICLLLALALFGMNARAAAVLEVGSRGDDVVKVQKRLIQYDYLDGTADGRYGEATRNAVRLFQKRNGLEADGKVGPATLAALGITEKSGGAQGSGDVYLLARLISAVMGTPTAISPGATLIALLFSSVIGVIFGLLPAVKAANLNPIDALRRE